MPIIPLLMMLGLLILSGGYLWRPRILDVVVTTRLDNLSVDDLHEFVTTIENDAQYYPGVKHTKIEKPGDEHEIGMVYKQSGVYNNFPFNITIEVKAATPTGPIRTLVHEGESLALAYHAAYTFQEEGGQAVFINRSTVRNRRFVYLLSAPGQFFSATAATQQLELYTKGSMEALITALQTSGTVEASATLVQM